METPNFIPVRKEGSGQLKGKISMFARELERGKTQETSLKRGRHPCGEKPIV